MTWGTFEKWIFTGFFRESQNKVPAESRRGKRNFDRIYRMNQVRWKNTGSYSKEIF